MGWSGVVGGSGVDDRLVDGVLNSVLRDEHPGALDHCIVDCMLKIQNAVYMVKKDK
jgi:hypothetical protein